MGFRLGVQTFYEFLILGVERYRKEDGIIYFLGFVSSARHLRLGGNGHRRLQVVRLQVALEVEDLELILLRQRQQLAQGRIRLDDLLVHQLVGLGVAADLRRHLRAGERRALRDTEERAERVRDGRRLREDRLLLDDRLTALRDGGSATAATLRRLLDLTGDLLLELLHVREDGGEHRTQGVDLLHEGGKVLHDVNGIRRRGGGNGGSDRGGNRRRNGGRGSDHLRGGSGSRGGGGSLLGRGTLGRGGGRAHCCYMCDRGVFWLNQTRGILSTVTKFPINQFCSPEVRKKAKMSAEKIF